MLELAALASFSPGTSRGNRNPGFEIEAGAPVRGCKTIFTKVISRR